MKNLKDLLVLLAFVGLVAATVGVAQTTPTNVLTGDIVTTTKTRTSNSAITWTDSSIQAFYEPTSITFETKKGPVTISMTDGKVTLPDGLTLDEASRGFWIAISKAYPSVREEMVASYAAQVWNAEHPHK